MKTRIRLLAFVVCFSGFGQSPARAQISLVDSGLPLELSWSVDYNLGTGLYDYRYTFRNTGTVDLQDSVRWTVAEDQLRGHAGLHHESDFSNAGGLFNYDRVVGGLPLHNYDWSNLDIAAGDSVSVGFSDAHGPSMERWRAESGISVAESSAFLAPVPGSGALGSISLTIEPGVIKSFAVEGSVAVPVAGGWQYRYFLRNTGNIAIGPTPDSATNHVDFYINQHPSHAGRHHEQFNEPDNGYASSVGFDSGGHDGMGRPPGVNLHNYFWEGLGAGQLWDPGVVLTLGFFDPHGPGFVGWGGRVLGSSAEGYYDSPSSWVVVPVPQTPVPEPSTLWAGVLVAGAALIMKFTRRVR